ncbi:hypothetical protein TIFTF001_032007 [Ficus carica]|uniref:C-JID domain-containing protein n=1 Tax=Ficus carica TaxID=3494 RepID=A0AA88J790_FICCA|nr:hypothetical protein TIFTF001_032007 [Ficus carica]
MSNLRFLKIYESDSVQESKVCLSQGLNSLPKFLVYLHWHKYPSKSFSLNFTPEKLVELSMPHSKVEKLIWNGNQNLVNLKRINLSYSDQLNYVPNLSKALNLESINLECCTSLRELLLDQNLDKLTFLNLKGCTRLQNLSVLPRNIACLDIRNCSTLVSIPTDIWELKSLSSLNLSGCSNLNSLPKISRPMECLIDLILDRTAIKNLPRSIFKLRALKTLSMNMCESLQFLPGNISRLYSLQCLSLRCCPKLKRLPALPPSLASVDARNCSSLERVSPSKAVIEGWNCNQHNGGAFIFYNCLNLKSDVQNYLMADARLRIMHIASVASKYGGDHTTEICWPGNGIPKWFKHHSPDQESSINVTLPSSRLDDTFLGFVFCVVVDFKDCNLDGDFEMYGESHCEFADGFVSTSRRTWNWHWNIHDSDNNGDKPTDKSSRAVNSPHVFIFYEKGQQILSNLRAGNYPSSSSSSSASANDNNVSITFKFQPRDPNGRVNPVNFPVKSCGVQLLYLRDIKKLGLHSHDDREPIPEEGEITVVEEAVEEDDEDENEPHLQENGTHSQEISDERKSFSCCLQLGSQILDCELCFGKKDTRATREMYSVTVTSTQTVQVTKAQWEKIQCRLDRLNDQNPRVYDALQRVEISRTGSGLFDCVSMVNYCESRSQFPSFVRSSRVLGVRIRAFSSVWRAMNVVPLDRLLCRFGSSAIMMCNPLNSRFGDCERHRRFSFLSEQHVCEFDASLLMKFLSSPADKCRWELRSIREIDRLTENLFV